MTNGPVDKPASSRLRFWGRLLLFVGLVLFGGFAVRGELRHEAILRWEADAVAAGLLAKVRSDCVIKRFNKIVLCRRLFSVQNPRVTIYNEEQMFKLFGLKHRCPAGLKIHCPRGRIPLVLMLLARRALDAEVVVYEDDCGPKPDPQAFPPRR